jgi:hypothetical protein
MGTPSFVKASCLHLCTHISPRPAQSTFLICTRSRLFSNGRAVSRDMQAPGAAFGQPLMVTGRCHQSRRIPSLFASAHRWQAAHPYR